MVFFLLLAFTFISLGCVVKVVVVVGGAVDPRSSSRLGRRR